MPLGTARLNTLARYVAEEGGLTGRTTTFTVYGGAQIDTAQSQFGSSSLYTEQDAATYDMVKADLDVATLGLANPAVGQALTIEFWMKPETGFTNSGAESLITNRLGGYGATEYMFLYDRTNQRMRFACIVGTSGVNETTDFSSSNNSVPVNSWTHIAIAHDGDKTWSGWADGTRWFNDVNTNDQNTFAMDRILQGGADTTGNLNNMFGGWIDEVRVSIVDRYGVSNASITVPTSALTNDANTLYLNHFEGSDGSTTFEDDDS